MGMKINIQSVGFTAGQQLLDFVQEKTGKLLRFDDTLMGANAILRLENANTKEERHVAEITLELRGDKQFASKSGATFEEAVAETLDALRSQLQRRKGKIRD